MAAGRGGGGGLLGPGGIGRSCLSAGASSSTAYSSQVCIVCVRFCFSVGVWVWVWVWVWMSMGLFLPGRGKGGFVRTYGIE